MATHLHASETYIKAAAYLWSIGRNQKHLAAELGISQPTVSRLIAEARRRNLIATTHKLSKQDLHAIDSVLYPRYEQLCSVLRGFADAAGCQRVSSVRVFGAGWVPDDGVATAQNRAIFGAAAAAHLHGLLGRMKCVGVSWGKTLAAVVHAFVTVFEGTPRHRRGKITFFPVCGEAVDFSVNEYSASTHASQLHRCVNLEEGSALSLGSTPARLPQKYDSDAPNGVREFIREAKAYRRIFLDESALINRMDTLLATAGSIYRDSTDLFMDDLIGMEDISRDELEAWTIGDVAGYFIPKEKLSRASAARVNDINARWTGITLRQVADCAQRARITNKLGVVLPLIGHSKTEIAIQALRLGLVNHLIIDRDLANHIVKMGRDLGLCASTS